MKFKHQSLFWEICMRKGAKRVKLFTQHRSRTITLGVCLATCMISSAFGSSLVSEFNPISNAVEVNYIATDQHVHQLWFNGAWHVTDLTTDTGAPNVAAGSALVSEFNPIANPNTVELNYIGTDQHVHQFWFNGTWHVGDLTAATGAPNVAAGSALASQFNSLENTAEVYYIGTDQHVPQSWFNGTWHAGDLTAATGASNVAAGSALASQFNSLENTAEVYYIGTDQHVHQFWINGTWHAGDLTAATGASNVAAGSALASAFNPIANPHTVEVNYIGTDQHVHQFWFNGTWHVGDLTAGTRAPNAAAGSALASEFNPISNAVEVNHIGTDQHVHQFWFNGTWHVQDLTAGTGAPNAAAGSALASEFNPISNA